MNKSLHLFLKNKITLLLLLAILLGSFIPISAQTNTYIGVSGGNWGTATNWSLNQVPTIVHDVTIPNNMVVIIDLPLAVCNKLTINTGANSNEVIVGANTLSISGALTINVPTIDNMNKIVSVSSGTLNCGSIVMGNSGTALMDCRVIVTSGILNVTGNITMGGNVNENQIILDGVTAGGTLNLGGNFTVTGGDLVPGLYSTVNFNGTVAQTISMNANFQYNNIVINNVAGATLSANVTGLLVLGDMTVQTGTLNTGGRSITLNAGKTFSLANGSRFNTTTPVTFPLPLPNLALGATSTVEYTGANQTVFDVVSPGYGHLIVSGTGTKTVAGDLDIQGDLTVQSSILTNGGFAINGAANIFSVANGAVFQLTGTSSFPTGFGTNVLGATSTVRYIGTIQTVFDVGFPGYGHLTLTASVKTVSGDLDIQGNLTVTSGIVNNGGFAISGSSGNTFSLATGATLQVAGTTSSFPSGFGTNTLGATSTVDYMGTDDQPIFDVASPGYGHLKVSTGGMKTAASDLEIQGTLTIATNATFAASAYTHNIALNMLNYGNVTASGIINVTGSFTNYGGGSVLMTSGGINLAGNWTNSASGTISLGSATVNLMGNWLNSGIFNAGTSTVNFNSIALKTITGTTTGAAGQFYNLTFDGIGGSWTPVSLDVANSLLVSNGTLSITGILTVMGTTPITVAPSGTLTLENKASLLQTGYSGINSGNINVKRTSAKIILNDFTYWSSPTTGSQTILDFSPNTRTDRIFTYHNAWSTVSPATDTFVKGIGYAITAPQGTTTIPASATALTYQFTGVPNNGDVDVTVSLGPPIANRLIGNPYPSAIDANAFISANVIGTGSVNATISGTLYFWTHNHTLVGNNYASSDYATYTLLGATRVATGTGNITTPTRYIASGQGFFVNTKANGNVSFRNSMRIGGVVANNANFYRSSNGPASDIVLEKHRIWLNLTNSTTSNFSQALVGYIETATNGVNPGFDGLYFGSDQFVLYSLLNDEAYTIQARALPFVDADIVPLGYKTNTAGNTTISIDEVDGLFLANQTVYLEDQMLHVTHDLKATPYSFNTEVGTFNNRFVLKYVNSALGLGNLDDFTNAVMVATKDHLIKIKSPSEAIKNIKGYDVLGRLIFEKNNVKANDFVISDVVSKGQTLLVNITLENGQIVNKKIVF